MLSIAKSKSEIQKEYAKRSGYAAQKKYDAENTKRIVIKLNKNTDNDILIKLNTLSNKAGYIKECIRKDIAEKK